VTWDRELSSKIASKKQIWTDLLTKNQVPYMAMLRNLRNILKADLDVPTIKMVIDTIQNPYKVQNAKIFPFQYFNALSEIDKLLSGFEEEQSDRGNYGRRGRERRLWVNRDRKEKVKSNQME
jgi:telomerase protein component 1